MRKKKKKAKKFSLAKIMSFRRGSDFEYSGISTAEHDATFQCWVCRSPAFDPVEQSSKIACRACVAMDDVSTAEVAPDIASVLTNLITVCPMCHIHMLRSALPAHAETCATPCVSGCGMSFLLPSERVEAQTHANECALVETNCSLGLGCKWSGQRRFQQQHQAKCPFVHLTPVVSVMLDRIDLMTSELQTANVERAELQSQCEAMRKLLREHQKKIEELQDY